MRTVAPPAETEHRSAMNRLPTWVLAATPLVLLAAVFWAIMALDIKALLRGPEFPPVEKLSVTRTVLRPGEIELHIANGGPDQVTVAQVQVDEAYWNFDMVPNRPLKHLDRAVITIPYHWVEGEAHQVVLLSQTGVRFPVKIDVAVASAQPSWQFFLLFAGVGLLVGVIPVYLGLIWYPVIRRLGDTGVNALLCFTVGLLAFLAVDAVHEALEVSSELPEVYAGVLLLSLGIGGSILFLMGVGQWILQRAAKRGETVVKLSLAAMIAVGIGLHNLGEGLAIGAAFNLGLIGLGGTLIAGFTTHNVTEGLAIVSPLARAKPGLGTLLLLGLVAGAPTVAGAWIGGFVYSKLWALVFLAVGAGAILQVTYEIVRQMAGSQHVRQVLTPLPNMAGLLAGFMLMYVTKLFVAI